VARCALVPTSERLLLGSGPQGAEIRLRVGHGPLAGAEIHLRSLAGGVEAVVLTRVESSRQTLAVAMEEVARRLQRKGYAFRAQARDAPPAAPVRDGSATGEAGVDRRGARREGPGTGASFVAMTAFEK
jgi:hypothetical protein